MKTHPVDDATCSMPYPHALSYLRGYSLRRAEMELQVFGLRSATLDLDRADVDLASLVTDDRFGLDFISCRVDADEIDKVDALQRHGFRFVGALTQFVIRPPLSPPISFPGTRNDGDSLAPDEAELCASWLTHSRFHNDPNLRRFAAGFYAEWLRRVSAGRGPAGQSIITCRNRESEALLGFTIYEAGRLVLIGVRPDLRGHGYGPSLARVGILRAMDLSEYAGSRVYLGTESTATAALNLYLSLGARFDRTLLSFHWHRGQA